MTEELIKKLDEIDRRLIDVETKQAVADVKLVEIAHNMKTIVELLTRAKQGDS